MVMAYLVGDVGLPYPSASHAANVSFPSECGNDMLSMAFQDLTDSGVMAYDDSAPSFIAGVERSKAKSASGLLSTVLTNQT